MRSVRARITVLATVVVSAALLIGVAGLLVVMQRALEHSGDEVARERVSSLLALAEDGVLPPTIREAAEDDLSQVVGADGAVLASSLSLAGRAPIASFSPDVGQMAVRNISIDDGVETEDYRVWAGATTVNGQRQVAYVGRNLDTAHEAVATARGVLLAGLPLLVIGVAVGAWVLTGRALRPVEAIRRQVADISARDLSQRVEAPPTSDEIERLSHTMNDMLDRLQTASDRERRFVADASHELQSPLATFRTQLELARGEPDGMDASTRADMLDTTVQMERLVRDLLFLARTDHETGRSNGSSEPRPMVDLDLDDIVLEEAARLAAQTPLPIDLHEVSAAPLVGHPEALRRAVRNLLENAARHARSRVSVELAADDGVVRLVVVDDGPGVPEEDRERVFERFARVDDARSRSEGGTGLGLAIVASVVHEHEGEVRVERAPAGGARFVVELPAQPNRPGE